jgi:RNA polymerase sigma-70 factor (ECF subfamily)
MKTKYFAGARNEVPLTREQGHVRLKVASNEERWAGGMRAALNGDSAAYAALLAELSRVLRAQVSKALSRAGRGNAEVEDIVQEVLLAIHLKRDSWNPELPFSPWLNAVARYKLIDCLRRRGSARDVAVEDLAEVLAAPDSTNNDRADATRLVSRLDERPRAIVEAISLEGRSAGEVATTLNMSEGAVRVALHRALKTLAKLYREEGA